MNIPKSCEITCLNSWDSEKGRAWGHSQGAQQNQSSYSSCFHCPGGPQSPPLFAQISNNPHPQLQIKSLAGCTRRSRQVFRVSSGSSPCSPHPVQQKCETRCRRLTEVSQLWVLINEHIQDLRVSVLWTIGPKIGAFTQDTKTSGLIASAP